jgi:hypothetical protein
VNLIAALALSAIALPGKLSRVAMLLPIQLVKEVKEHFPNAAVTE